jgi:cysteinyl-tRNA synthetase
MFKLYNSLTRKKEIFTPIKSEFVTLYVCGITPYDTTHLGHAFTYISFDILVRTLKMLGLKVIYTQNVTDINDRDNDLLKKAKEKHLTWQELGNYWTKKFLQDMSTLNWIKPDNYIKASENIEGIIGLVNMLLKNGYAYNKNGSVYFDIKRKKDFGKLSRLNPTEMLKIAKDFEEDIDNPDKKNPLDITLWRAKAKNESSHIPSFKSPFGPPAGGGRPGWHIECSAMSISTLGEQIDIHGGGIDLIYPHHEAEIAQSEGATLKIPFAKYWLHTAFISYQGKKMSKSLGNLIMVSDLLKKYSTNAIRWYLISHHYRDAFEFFERELQKSNAEFLGILKYINNLKPDDKPDKKTYKKIVAALENDLDTPLVLKIVQEIVKNKGSVKTIKKCLLLLGFIV